MERQDLFEDDLTEERQPSPSARDDVAGSETLDPDEPDNEVEADDDEDDDEKEGEPD